MNGRALLVLGLAGWLAVPGCRHASVATPAPDFRTGEVRIASPADTAVFHVEIAETPEQHSLGLMGRQALPESAGMLFLFDEEQPPGTLFWMHRTYVPLSVALLDPDGVILEVLEMEPCGRRLSLLCPKYGAGVPFHAALEVNRGSLQRRGLGVGDRVLLHRPR